MSRNIGSSQKTYKPNKVQEPRRDNKKCRRFHQTLRTISLGRLFFSGAVIYLLIVGVLVIHVSLLSSLNNIRTSTLRQTHGMRIDNIADKYKVNQRQHLLAGLADNKEGASACLLVSDENPRLPEWIAYHYHTLPLRSLTVAVDPASRSSPLDILQRWNDTGLIEMQLWNDGDFLHKKVSADVYGHRDRQNRFITKCMADFKRRNKQWVLLIDVDEYITFNRIDENNDPAFPTEKAPDGIPTLMDWEWFKAGSDGLLNGWINKSSSPTYIETDFLVSRAQLQPGGIVTDRAGNSYYIQNDRALHDLDALDEPPEEMPILTYTFNDADYNVCGEIINDIYEGRWDKEWVCIKVDWEIPKGDHKKTNIYHGGHVIEDLQHRKYFQEKEQRFWPKGLSVKEAKEARERLPKVGERKTILDVVKEETNRHGYEKIGSCITMPRLRYGPFEAPSEAQTSMFSGEINSKDFVTLRYRWHGVKGIYAYGKTLIDVSRIPSEKLQEEAYNIHAPLVHYCHRQDWFYSPHYVKSPFRVNHYLDSFEAYTYRKDIRVELRQSIDRYNTLAQEGNHSMDIEGSPWLQEFVQEMGIENAKMLLAGAGSFPNLTGIS